MDLVAQSLYELFGVIQTKYARLVQTIRINTHLFFEFFEYATILSMHTAKVANNQKTLSLWQQNQN